MKRTEFIKSSLIIGGAAILPSNSAFAAAVEGNVMDKLVDENGNFI